MFEAEGKRQAGYGIHLMMPFVKLYERIKYGDYASNTAMDGFLKSGTEVLIVHSTDDNIIPIEYGFDIYYEKYKDDPRFSFIRLEDKGHNYVYNDMTYINEFIAEYDRWLERLGYDYKAKENKKRYSQDREEYIHNNLDRDKYCDMLNVELFESFVSFYDEHLK